MCPRGGEEEGGLKADDAMDVHFPDGNLELSRSLMRALRHTGISLHLSGPVAACRVGTERPAFVEQPRCDGDDRL